MTEQRKRGRNRDLAKEAVGTDLGQRAEKVKGSLGI